MRPPYLLAIAALAAGPGLGACSFQGNGNPGDDQGDDVVADDTGDDIGDDAPPPVDAPVADAEGTPDAEPPSPPDAFVPPPVTETFGERPTSTHQGVTTDTYVDSFSQFSTFSTQVTVRVDPDTGGTNSRNGLVKFDLAAVPDGATITAATLRLYTANGGGGGPEVSFYVMNQPWNGAATWRESGLGAWLANGANPPSRGTAVIATLPASADETAYAVALPLPVVQAWVTNPASNEGLALVVETADTDDVYLRSANNETEADRPELELTWVPAD